MIVTVPTGPVANAHLTSDQRLAQEKRTRTEHNDARQAWITAPRAAVDAVTVEVPF